MTADVAAAQAAKREGQERSVEGRDAERAAFMTVIARVAPDTRVSVNRLRGELDEAGIPPSMRGGMFAAAVTAGLIQPLLMPDGFGGQAEVREHSTGASARRATVRVYVRTRAGRLVGGHAHPVEPEAAATTDQEVPLW